MKKRALVLLLLVLSLAIINFYNISAQDISAPQMPSNLAGIPITETGEIDTNSLANYKSDIEAKIEIANSWLAKFPWAKYVFGMEPKVSWPFLVNLILIFILLDYLFFYPLPSTISDDKKVIIRLIGLGIVVALIEFKLVSELALIITGWGGTKWWRSIIVFVLFGSIAFGLISLRDFITKWIHNKEINKLPRKIKMIEREARERDSVSGEMAKVVKKTKEQEEIEREAEEQVRDIVRE